MPPRFSAWSSISSSCRCVLSGSSCPESPGALVQFRLCLSSRFQHFHGGGGFWLGEGFSYLQHLFIFLSIIFIFMKLQLVTAGNAGEGRDSPPWRMVDNVHCPFQFRLVTHLFSDLGDALLALAESYLSSEVIPLLVTIITPIFLAASNLLQHTDISEIFDDSEDIAKILALLFLFFLNNWTCGGRWQGTMSRRRGCYHLRIFSRRSDCRQPIGPSPLAHPHHGDFTCLQSDRGQQATWVKPIAIALPPSDRSREDKILSTP